MFSSYVMTTCKLALNDPSIYLEVDRRFDGLITPELIDLMPDHLAAITCLVTCEQAIYMSPTSIVWVRVMVRSALRSLSKMAREAKAGDFDQIFSIWGLESPSFDISSHSDREELRTLLSIGVRQLSTVKPRGGVRPFEKV